MSDLPEFRGAPVGNSADLDRILALPRRRLDLTDPTAAIAWTKHLRRERTTPCDCVKRWGYCITDLRPLQGWALEEASNCNGLLGSIGVGEGKTALDILLPMAVPNCRVAVLLIPAALKAQFLTVDVPQWSAHFHVPSIAGGTFEVGRPVLHVITYSELSQQKSIDLLTRINPDLVIGDESQNIKDASAARTMRFLSFVRKAKGSRGAYHSGTITSTHPSDYAHLAAHALKAGTPTPLHPAVLAEWDALLGVNTYVAPTGAFMKLVSPGQTPREAFSDRFAETPGVIATGEGRLNTVLTIHERNLGTPAEVKAMVAQVIETSQRPDGEELQEDLQVRAAARQAACGFYYRWRYPRGEPENLIRHWLEMRKLWHREVRTRLTYAAQTGLDSPGLLKDAAERWHLGYWFREGTWTDPVFQDSEDGPQLIKESEFIETSRRFIEPKTKSGPLKVWAAEHFMDWYAVRDSVQPEEQAVWVNDFMVRDAVEWARSRVGIVWYEYSALGKEIERVGKLIRFGGGDAASAEIIRETGSRSIVASIKAHGTGKNLQRAFHENLVTSNPADGATWEQLLGRTHRQQQPKPNVEFYIYRHTQQFAQAFESARKKAHYIQETTKAAQRLCYANFTFQQG